jgi:hypothetical protein
MGKERQCFLTPVEFMGKEVFWLQPSHIFLIVQVGQCHSTEGCMVKEMPIPLLHNNSFIVPQWNGQSPQFIQPTYDWFK